jgi:hypothetical protein
MEGEPNKNSNGIPLRGNLTESNIAMSQNVWPTNTLYELENNPNRIIRIDHRNTEKFNVVELAQMAKDLYGELNEKYGINVPASFFVGKDKYGKEAIYSVVDKIDGKPLCYVEKNEEVVEKTKKLYASLAKYFFDKFQNSGDFLWDLCKTSQYVYGKKPGEVKNEIFFVDTDLRFHNTKTDLYNEVLYLTEYIVKIEEQFGIKLNEARSYVQQLIELPLPEGINEKHIKEIKKSLNL